MKKLLRLGTVIISVSTLSACHMIMFDMGLEAGRSGDYCKAAQYYQDSLSYKPDYGASLNNLARLYESGLCVPQDLNKAVNLFEQAVDTDNTGTAALNLGKAYDGKIVASKATGINKQKAREYYLKACNKRNSEACNLLNNY